MRVWSRFEGGRERRGLMRKRAAAGIFGVVATVAAVLASGCGGGEALSLSEYAAACDALRSNAVVEGLAADDSLTWGEAASALRRNLEAAEALSPPSELRRWHRATVSVLRITLGIAEDQDGEDEVSIGPLANASLALAAGRASSETEGLSVEARSALSAGGCPLPR